MCGKRKLEKYSDKGEWQLVELAEVEKRQWQWQGQGQRQRQRKSRRNRLFLCVCDKLLLCETGKLILMVTKPNTPKHVLHTPVYILYFSYVGMYMKNIYLGVCAPRYL